MSNTGYSKTLLIKKLGLKPDMKVMLISQPNDYFKMLEENITDLLIKENEIPDFVHLFVTTIEEFENEMKKLIILIRKIQK